MTLTSKPLLKNRIAKFLEERGITPYRFWQDTGISSQTAYRLVNDPFSIPRESVLAAICTRYRVQPNEVIIWVPDDDAA
jgi:DNA-binding Xre family transcriptional regulator